MEWMLEIDEGGDVGINTYNSCNVLYVKKVKEFIFVYGLSETKEKGDVDAGGNSKRHNNINISIRSNRRSG